MEYKVLMEDGYSRTEVKSELEKKVVELLNQGWNLCGGVSIAITTRYGRPEYYLTQAMVK